MTYKAKSLKPQFTDTDIAAGCHSVSFLSFERAIRVVLETEGRTMDEVIGYRVNEQGIEIIWS